MPQKKRRKSRTILFQIALIFLAVMLVLLVSFSAAMYTSTVNSFLEAQEESMEVVLNRMQDLLHNQYHDSPGVAAWYINHWEKYAERLSAIPEEDIEWYGANDEEQKIMNEFDASHADQDPTSIEYLEQLPEEIKYYNARILYGGFLNKFNKIVQDTNYRQLFMIDTFNNTILVNYGGNKKLGDRCPLNLSQSSAYEKIIESHGTPIIAFEKSRDFPEMGDYYIGYMPFYADGHLQALFCVTYDWKQIRIAAAQSLKIALLISIVIMIAAICILLAALYYWSVKPVKQIEQALIDYTDDKSSKMIVKKMYDIKAQNEIGYLADVISDLALEIDLYTKENLRVQQELYDAQVQVMVSQIRPHFMYNALSSIAILCKLDPATAYEATVTFSKYLRGNMDSLKQTKPVPFERELEHLKQYLYIEKLRFADKLNIEYDIQATDFKVPMLSIQPIVENAVKHGVGMKREGGTVTIASKETETGYEIIISDDGVGFDINAPKKDDGRSHIGMENTRKRLRDMCHAEIIITSQPGEGTTARIIIPKETEEDTES